MKTITESTKDPNKINKPKRTPRKILNELLTGIEEGNVEQVRNALDKGVDVNQTLPSNYLPITYATHCGGYPEIVRLLIEAGADVDKWDKNYYTPLGRVFSSPRKHIHEEVEAIVKMLLDAGASVRCWEGINGNGYTPLVEAVHNFASPKAIKMLLDAGADIGNDWGANCPMFDVLWNLSWHSDEAKSLSHEDRLEVAKLFLDAGAKVSIQRLLKRSVGNIPALKFFLNQQGANINGLLWEAVDNAAYYKDFAPLEFLLERGADINEEYDDGETPLFKAVREAQECGIDATKFLIEHGADINKQGGEYKTTPLIEAIWGTNPDIMEYLLQQGADTTLKTTEGETVVDIAKRVDKMDSYCDGEIENPFHGRVALLRKYHVI